MAFVSSWNDLMIVCLLVLLRTCLLAWQLAGNGVLYSDLKGTLEASQTVLPTSLRVS